MHLGTFNTWDGKGRLSDFADIILITEGVAKKVRRQLKATHRVYVCGFQRDLSIAISRDLDVKRVVKHYRLVHPGVAKVTPHRGSFWLTLLLEGEPSAILVDHRINAAFPPYRRGESWLRPRWWSKHDRVTNRILERQVRKGRDALAGGDPNVIRGVRAYSALPHEVSKPPDALASTRPLGPVRVLSKLGSDHWRIKAKVG